MEISQISPAILALTPVVMALTSIAKSFVDSRYSGLVSIVLGIAGAFLFPAESVAATVLSGLVVGLTASGAYSGVKSAVNG